MAIDDDMLLFEGVPILRWLGDGALRSLAIAVESLTVEADHVLFTAGDTADGAFIVQQGSFSLKPQHAGEDEIIAGPGTLLGESALLAETKRPATATARENSVVLRISRAMFLKILDSYPDAAHRLRDLMASRTDQWAREMQNVRTTLTRDRNPS